jgi:hypothetical protein
MGFIPCRADAAGVSMEQKAMVPNSLTMKALRCALLASGPSVACLSVCLSVCPGLNIVSHDRFE